jgi:cyclophilin family peptidyl-prolyl cis-trans isomerase
MASSLKHNPVLNFAVGLLTLLCLNVSAEAQVSESEARYMKAMSDTRDLVKVCRNISTRFFDDSHAESFEWKEKWAIAAKDLADQRIVLEEAAIDWFFECKKPNMDLLSVLGAISREIYAAGNFELSYKILEKIAKFRPDDIKLMRQMALAGIKCNKFDAGMELVQTQKGLQVIGELERQLDKNMFGMCPTLVENWEREAELRKQEAEADKDNLLPRVKLEIGSDVVVLELFENEAPETVANFISLVESGYYDDSYCAPVVKDIIAQAGFFNRSTGSVPVGYVIKNESILPNARKHFAGSLTMASDGTKDSASTVFGITLVPNPELDWNGEKDDEISQTVFGRVVEGMQVINTLPATIEIDEETQEENKIKDAEPKIITKATVIRKRNHEYKFERIKETSK